MNLEKIISCTEDAGYFIVIAVGESPTLNEKIEFKGHKCRVLRISGYVRDGDMFKMQLLKLGKLESI